MNIYEAYATHDNPVPGHMIRTAATVTFYWRQGRRIEGTSRGRRTRGEAGTSGANTGNVTKPTTILREDEGQQVMNTKSYISLT